MKAHGIALVTVLLALPAMAGFVAATSSQQAAARQLRFVPAETTVSEPRGPNGAHWTTLPTAKQLDESWPRGLQRTGIVMISCSANTDGGLQGCKPKSISTGDEQIDAAALALTTFMRVSGAVARGDIPAGIIAPDTAVSFTVKFEPAHMEVYLCTEPGCDTPSPPKL